MATVKQKQEIEKLTFLAKVSEAAENYIDMADFIKKLIASK